MKSWFATFLTTETGKSDTMLAMTVLGVLSYIGYAGYDLLWLHNHFDPFQYATGFGAMIAASAGGMGLRTKLTATPQSMQTDGGSSA